jgi:hypothetical protein
MFAQLDLPLIERLLDKFGLTTLLALVFAWGLIKHVFPAMKEWFDTAAKTQESNADALTKVSMAQADTVRCIEHLKGTAVASGDNHSKSHRAGLAAADALQAFADTHSKEASSAVKPHVERIKEILDK